MHDYNFFRNLKTINHANIHAIFIKLLYWDFIIRHPNSVLFVLSSSYKCKHEKNCFARERTEKASHILIRLEIKFSVHKKENFGCAISFLFFSLYNNVHLL